MPSVVIVTLHGELVQFASVVPSTIILTVCKCKSLAVTLMVTLVFTMLLFAGVGETNAMLGGIVSMVRFLVSVWLVLLNVSFALPK